MVNLDGPEEVGCSLDDDHDVRHMLLDLLDHPSVVLAHLPHGDLLQFVEEVAQAREGGASIGVKQGGGSDNVAVLDAVREA